MDRDRRRERPRFDRRSYAVLRERQRNAGRDEGREVPPRISSNAAFATTAEHHTKS